MSGETDLDFWQKVDRRGPDDCWLWTKGRHTRGYGIFYIAGRQYTAHRYALLLTVGEPPADKPHALHSCDNLPCCNPQHLRWGTPADNMEDKRRRGRAFAPNANRSVCPQGHDLTSEANVLHKVKKASGRTYNTRGCRECNRIYLARRRAAKKVSAA